MKVVHDIPPLFDARSRVLILGSLPSPKSREAGFYYMHPQNRFWRVLAAVFGEAEPLTKEDRAEFALARGIAIWDVVAECEITGAADSSVKNAKPNDFSIIPESVRTVFTTGALATKLYKQFTGNSSVRLPSPSPANCAMAFDSLVMEYSKIKDALADAHS